MLFPQQLQYQRCLLPMSVPDPARWPNVVSAVRLARLVAVRVVPSWSSAHRFLEAQRLRGAVAVREVRGGSSAQRGGQHALGWAGEQTQAHCVARVRLWRVADHGHPTLRSASHAAYSATRARSNARHSGASLGASCGSARTFCSDS